MTIKEIIQKLHITMTDASVQESHFESWMTLNEGIINAIDALKALDKQEPVALMIYRGELCYKSQADDQSFGMWCPVTKDLPFPEGTKLYTTPPQRKPLSDEQIEEIAEGYLVDYRIPAGCAWNFARDIEATHGIKG